MRIAIFGGSFDPAHTEHICVAERAIAELALDKLFVMPAHAPPHKKGKELTADAARLEMCRLAFAKVDRAEVSDYEIRQGGTSYTYLTCKHFKEKYPQAQLFWIVGTDMLRDFPTWKNPEEILSYATLAVCGRNEKGAWIEREQKNFLRLFGKEFAYFSYNGADVSSTKIRVLAGAGMHLTPFVPCAVEEYIQQNDLYKIPFAKEALQLQKTSRQEHSLRVAEIAAAKAVKLKRSERQAIAAALFHDCAKNLPRSSPYLEGFSLPTAWGKVPEAVEHQFAGAYLAEKLFGVSDEEIRNAIRYHTSGRPNMGELEKLIFLADMVEEGRSYDGVDLLRALFWKDLDECLTLALKESILFIEKKGGEVYPLTLAAYEFYGGKYGKNNK